MPETIERARKLIEAHLRELEDEAEGLKRALQSFGEKAPAKRCDRPRGKSATRKRKSVKRAPRGQRREQFLAALQKRPGAQTTEVAKQLGISATQAYTLAGRLHKEGAIRKSGKGYRLSKKVAASK
jgi:hypothetical protein